MAGTGPGGTTAAAEGTTAAAEGTASSSPSAGMDGGGARLDASGFATLVVEERGDRLHARLHRPEVRNAIDQTMVDELHAVCAHLEQNRIGAPLGCSLQQLRQEPAPEPAALVCRCHGERHDVGDRATMADAGIPSHLRPLLGLDVLGDDVLPPRPLGQLRPPRRGTPGPAWKQHWFEPAQRLDIGPDHVSQPHRSTSLGATGAAMSGRRR